MGLMPVYYTTTKLSGRKKSSVRNQRLNKEHEKWLRSMGIDKSWKPKSETLKIRPKAEILSFYIKTSYMKTFFFIKFTVTFVKFYPIKIFEFIFKEI